MPNTPRSSSPQPGRRVRGPASQVPAEARFAKVPTQGSGAHAAPRNVDPNTRRGRRVAPASPTSTTPPKKNHRFFNYPRRGKGPIRRWIPSWRFVLMAGLLVILAGVGGFFWLYQTTKLPDPNSAALAQNSAVYFNNGTNNQPIGYFSSENRQVIASNQMPASLKNALVSSEDRTFYSNSGVNPTSMIRSFLNNVRGRATQGGSTITEQYIKTYYLGLNKNSITDKLRESILALKVTREESKDEILTNYLNTVYFGRGANGIQAASEAYFGVSASQLTQSQAALLVGVLPAPSAYDPEVNKSAATSRWTYVLGQMVKNGYLTQSVQNSLTFPTTVDYKPFNSYQGTNGYLLQMAHSELLKTKNPATGKDFTEQDLSANGLKIITTIDPVDQNAARMAAQSIPQQNQPAGLREALISVDPNTGGILAIYGGSDYQKSPQNTVTQDSMPVGSTFKPFALIAAMQKNPPISLKYKYYAGYSPQTIKNCGGGETWGPIQNSQGEQFGSLNLISALTYSVNTVFAQLNNDVGPKNTQQAAITAGIPASETDPYCPNVLGATATHPIDMATAYSTIASGGVKHTTHIVASVQNSSGKTIYTANTSGERVFPADVMSNLTYAMQQVTQDRGTGATAGKLVNAQGTKVPIAGKTGTTDNNQALWFDGFTPNVVTVVSVFNTDTSGNLIPVPDYAGGGSNFGGGLPTNMWLNYMTTAVANQPITPFPTSSFAPPTYSYTPRYNRTPTATAPAIPNDNSSSNTGQSNGTGNSGGGSGSGGTGGGGSGNGGNGNSGGSGGNGGGPGGANGGGSGQ